jgi:Glycosyltransferase 61
VDDLGEFEDVLVTSYEDLLHVPAYERIANWGGPLWPDWEARSFERHCRDRVPADVRPQEPRIAASLSIPVAFWGGPITGNFGHQIADFSMRILPSRMHDPGAKLLFVRTVTEIPDWFTDILRWCEIDPDDAIIIDRLARVEVLKVCEQSEQLWSAGPTERHLDGLDEFIARKRLDLTAKHPVVYVSRASLSADKSVFAGERYLESCIAESGGLVFRPESHDIATQLTVYMQAQHLVFAEGSALHLCQFAGRQFGNVDVLVRRRSSRFASSSFGKSVMAPRSRSFRHIHAIRDVIEALLPNGKPALNAALTLSRTGELVDYFEAIGVELRKHWDQEDFAHVADEDIANWINAHTGGRPHSDRHVVSGLTEAELFDHADNLARRLNDVSS